MSPSSLLSRLKKHVRRDHGGKSLESSRENGDQNDDAIASSTISAASSTSIVQRPVAVLDMSQPAQSLNIQAQVESPSPERPSSPTAQSASSVHQSITAVSAVSPLPLASPIPAASLVDSSTSNTLSSDPLNLAERLWDQAYDDLKTDESTLVMTYEKILSCELDKNASQSTTPELQTNVIEQADPGKRRFQMGLLVQAGLEKTEGTAKVKQVIGEAVDVILSAKEIIGLAVQTVPQAALAWAGVSLALQILQNPTTETKSNREGIIHVISRMQWYWNLSSLLLRENTIDEGLSAGLRRELGKRVIDLYKVLLSYQMKSVCSYYRNQFLSSLRDILKLDHWDGNLKSIQEAENTVRQDSYAYNTQQITSYLEDLVKIANTKQTKLLEEISRVLQEQLDKTELAYYSGLESPLHRLPYAVAAPFNSSQRRHEPICLPNTRVDLLQEIYAWANGHDERFIFWLNGLAGTGKSTIARTIARKYFENGQLGASFFFSRGGGDIGHASKFFTTIAIQLSKKSQSLLRHICDALTKNKDIATQSLGDQWRQLILGPLSKLSGDSYPSSYILVIDALDECDNDKDIRIILQLLAEAQSLKTIRLRVLLTSRPEIPIRYGFHEIPEAEHQDFVLHNISPSIVDHDIAIFLKYNLGLIGQKKPLLGASWPGEETVKQLVEIASGLFIWAATACRFIQEVERAFLIRKRLAAVLQADSSSAENKPERHLNEIYITVLRHSIQAECSDKEKEEILSMLRNILGSIVTLLSPLSVHSLSGLLNFQSEVVDDCLEDMHAILDIPKDQTRPPRLHHPSFRDFLLNKDRCDDSNFWVDEKQAHQRLASSCIQLLSASLKEDICGVTIPGTLIADIESSRVEKFLPLEVQYACLHWIQHLQRSSTQLRDNDHVDQFLRNHFLHWLEALSWMQKISEGILEMISLESIAPAANCPSLYGFIHDMKRFALHNRAAIEQAPLQVYYSALLFTPVMTIVRRQFRNKMPGWIKRGPEVETNWNATVQILEGHSDGVNTVAFSPDGKQLASGSDDKTVRVWDTATGATVQILEGHSDGVYTVAFSPNGKQLASSSYDKTVRVWDTATGATVQILEGHSDGVNTVAFSPDGKQLASGSDDKTVRVWDTATGATVQILEGHSDGVNTVAFSPDGKQLASGSYDKTVWVWDTATGATVQILEGHSDGVNTVAFSPDGKQLASGSYDKTVRVWDTATGATVQILEGHSDGVYTVAFSPDGKQLASGSYDKTVRVWDTATGATVQILEGHSDGVYTVAFSPNGKQLVSSSDDKTVRVWDTATGATVQILEGHSDGVNTVAFSPDGKQLASGSYDKTVRVWDTATGATVQILEGHSDGVNTVAFSPNGKQLASSSYDKTVRVWDTATGATVQILEGHSDGVNTVAFSPDGKQLASSSDDKTVRVWDTATGATVQILEGHSDGVNTVAFSPDGKQLVSSSDDKTVRVWDTATGATVQILEANTAVTTLSYSSDGSIVTDCGQLDAISLCDNAAISSLPLSPLSRSVAFRPRIFVQDEWIAYGDDRILWLPPDYRPFCSAVREGIVCLGHRSGRVSIFEFLFSF